MEAIGEFGDSLQAFDIVGFPHDVPYISPENEVKCDYCEENI